jgi:rubrerythrin
MTYRCYVCTGVFNKPEIKVIGHKGFLRRKKITLGNCPLCKGQSFGRIDLVG